MSRFPTVLVSDVVRSTSRGESHGGLYLVNLETDTTQQVLDWNGVDIDWTGRGGERGLRGIAIHERAIYVAASNQILALDTDFRILRRYQNPYLADCHEIWIDGHTLYIASTGHDSILELDLNSGDFTAATLVRWRINPETREPIIEPGKNPLIVRAYSPLSPEGPRKDDTTHLNMVSRFNGVTYACGVNLLHLVAVDGTRVRLLGKLPGWTHNTRPYGDSIIFNSTDEDRVCVASFDGTLLCSVPVPRYEPARLQASDTPNDVARQAFARGLTIWRPKLSASEYLIGGSSPSTISVYDPQAQRLIKSTNFGMDVRNAPHGLVLWPFG